MIRSLLVVNYQLHQVLAVFGILTWSVLMCAYHNERDMDIVQTKN